MTVDNMTKSMLGLTTGLQATSLAVSNIPRRKKKRNMVRQGVRNMLGIGMIGAQSDMIGSL